MTIKLIENVAELNKAVDAWGKRGQKWMQEGHVLAMSALAHHCKHGDTGPVNRLFLAMPKGSKSAAMAEWFLSFGALSANADPEGKKTSPFKHDKEKTPNLVEAAKNPWYEFQPEKAPDELFDVRKALMAIIKKADKASQIEGQELLSTLRGLVGDDPEVDAGTKAMDAVGEAEL